MRPILLLLALCAAVLAPAQTVVGWGGNAFGQIAPPAGLTGVAGIAAGDYHGLAVRTNGTVAAWGNNEGGQCDVPAGLSGVVQVAAGGYHSLALKSDGTVVSWGIEDEGPPAGLADAVRIAAGAYHALALRADGTVLAWGNNDNGQCAVPAGLSGVVGIAAGDSHSLALKSDGTVVAWGDDSAGQSRVPAGLSGVVQVAGGGFHSLALKSDGTVVAWGDDSAGQSTVPAGLAGVVGIDGGYAHSVARRADGGVVAWGWNDSGQGNVPAGLARTTEAVGGYDSTLALVPLELRLDRSALYAGETATGTVNVLQPAPPGGTTVALASDDPSVHVPAAVTVPAGATTATFPVTTTLVFREIPRCRISADLDGARLTAPLKVTGQTATLKSSHASIVGGSTTNPTLTVTLAWPLLADATLALDSDGALGLPASIRIPAGATSAKVAFVPGRVAADAVRTILLTSGAEAAGSTTVKILALRATVSFGEPVVDGGQGTLGFVYLNAPVREGIAIPVASGDAAVRPLVSSVSIGPGARQAHFDIATDPVPAAKSVRVTATVNGNPFFATLKVNALPAVKSLTLPASAYGQNRVVGTVRLTTVARPGGTTVTLVSSDPALSVPAQVTVPEGQYAATFEAWSADVAVETAATVTVTGGASSATAGVLVRPITVSALTLSAASVAAGESVTGTVTLNAPVLVATTVELTSQFPDVVAVPATVTIPAGGKTATFTLLAASPGATAKSVRITAKKNGTAPYRTLKVNP